MAIRFRSNVVFMQENTSARWWMNNVNDPNAEVVMQAIAVSGVNQVTRPTVSSSDSGNLQPNITDASIGNPFPRFFVTVTAYTSSFFQLVGIE
jgi:hypothetical protein